MSQTATKSPKPMTILELKVALWSIWDDLSQKPIMLVRYDLRKATERKRALQADISNTHWWCSAIQSRSIYRPISRLRSRSLIRLRPSNSLRVQKSLAFSPSARIFVRPNQRRLAGNMSRPVKHTWIAALLVKAQTPFVWLVVDLLWIVLYDCCTTNPQLIS